MIKILNYLALIAIFGLSTIVLANTEEFSEVKKEFNRLEPKLITLTWDSSSCALEYANKDGVQLTLLVPNICNYVIENLCDSQSINFNVPKQGQATCFTKRNVDSIKCNARSWEGVPSNYAYIKLGGCRGKAPGSNCLHSHNKFLATAKSGSCVSLGGVPENPECGCQ